jgi:glutamine synthetase
MLKVKLLRLLGDQEVTRVTATLGIEQEFFLIDRRLYSHRMDLKTTGRTLPGIGLRACRTSRTLPT